MAGEPLSITTVGKSSSRIALSICALTLIAIVTGLVTFLIGTFTIFPWAPRPIRSALDQPNMVPLIFWILFVIVQIGLLTMTVRFLFNRQPGLVLDKDGFTYWVSIFKVETVPWHVVDRIELSQDRFVRFLVGRFLPDSFLTLAVYTKTNPHDWTIMEKFWRWMGIGDKVFMAPYISKSKNEVYELMRTYLVASKSEFIQ